MLETATVYRPIEPDCRKCKRAILDGDGHAFCTAIGEWGDLSECDGTCRFFSEKKHNRKKVSKWAKK
jgi:hypothetical protein